MQVDIKTSDIRPIRQTFSHVARRLGADKPASRYQEATLDLQSTTNFHYRPLWEPEYELYDKRRTAIEMTDWYAFKDPRHYYYGAYTIARAKQQEGVDRQFEFVEKRELLARVDDEVRRSLQQVLVPLRHYECWPRAHRFPFILTLEDAANPISADRHDHHAPLDWKW